MPEYDPEPVDMEIYQPTKQREARFVPNLDLGDLEYTSMTGVEIQVMRRFSTRGVFIIQFKVADYPDATFQYQFVQGVTEIGRGFFVFYSENARDKFEEYKFLMVIATVLVPRLNQDFRL